jgi:hypothetical protein
MARGAVLTTGFFGTIENSLIYAHRNNSSSAVVTGISFTGTIGQLIVKNVNILAEGGADTTGNIYGIYNGCNSSRVCVQGNNIKALTSGSGIAYDLYNTAGSLFTVAGCAYDSAATSGTITQGGSGWATAVNAEVDTALEDYNSPTYIEWSDGNSLVVANQTTTQADLDIITGASGVLIDDGAITSAKFDESTAYPLESADSGSTQIARVGADSDTLKTLSDEISALNNLSKSDVNDSIDQRLAVYDSPTHQELLDVNDYIASKIDDVNGIAGSKTGYFLDPNGLMYVNTGEQELDPNLWDFRDMLLLPFAQLTNKYTLQITDLNDAGFGILTIYKRDDTTPFLIQSTSETNDLQIRGSIW